MATDNHSNIFSRVGDSAGRLIQTEIAVFFLEISLVADCAEWLRERRGEKTQLIDVAETEAQCILVHTVDLSLSLSPQEWFWLSVGVFFFFCTRVSTHIMLIYSVYA